MIGYRREIDGLRALAVVPVMLFHAGFAGASGGYVGVDVFFVISGYLITSIIVSEQEAGGFSLARFYERRARRILPALFLVMAASLPAAWWWLTPTDLEGFARSLVAVPLFISNFLFWRESGYFDTAAELKPLLHTWSLAVEEQYYVLFPWLLMGLWRFGRRRLAQSLMVIGVLSLAFAHWGAYYRPAGTFFLLTTRAWELAIGALVALFLYYRGHPSVNTRSGGLVAGLGLAMIAGAVAGFDKTTPFPSLYALLPTVGTALVILFATPTTATGRLLEHRIPVGIGLVSYSAYLWHQPLFAFARHASHGEPPPGVMAGLIGVALVLAYVSWRFVERPFRRKDFLTRTRLFQIAAAASLCFIALGWIGKTSHGFAAYYAEHRVSAEERELYQMIRQHTGGDVSREMIDDGACQFWKPVVDADFERRFLACAQRYGPGLVVLGDSHAMNLYNIFALSGIERFVVGVSQGGCRPHDNHAYCHYDGFTAFLARHREKVGRVVFHQSGSYFLRDRRGKVDTDDAFKPDAPFLFDDRNLDKLMTYLDGLAGQTDVIWAGPFVEARVNFRDFKLLRGDFRIPEKSFVQFEQLEVSLQQAMARRRTNFRYLSLWDIFAIDRSFLRKDDCVTYRDKDHFSRCGERVLAIRLAAARDRLAIGGSAPR